MDLALLLLLHPGDLTSWQLLGLLAVYALGLLVVVGLPLGLLGFIAYKLVEHRRSLRETRFPE